MYPPPPLLSFFYFYLFGFYFLCIQNVSKIRALVVPDPPENALPYPPTDPLEVG
mgnify:CR=1 FL=1